LRLPNGNASTIFSKTILARFTQNILNFVLIDIVSIDMGKASLGVDVETNIHDLSQIDFQKYTFSNSLQQA